MGSNYCVLYNCDSNSSGRKAQNLGLLVTMKAFCPSRGYKCSVCDVFWLFSCEMFSLFSVPIRTMDY